MRLAPCVLALTLAGAVAGCGSYYSRTYDYGPSYAYAPAPGYYTTSYAYSSTPADRYVYSSRWDYYRNYNGAYHPGPEHYP
jgi:hypothetical protein